MRQIIDAAVLLLHARAKVTERPFRNSSAPETHIVGEEADLCIDHSNAR